MSDRIVVSTEELISGRILFIGAHPDDIEIGCGGTAAKYAARGNAIAFAVATREANEKKANKRTREAIKAARILDLSEENRTLFFGKLQDTQLDGTKKEVRNWLKEVSNEFRPDTVFFHRNDDHTDHQAIYQVSIGVFQSHNALLYYIPRPFPETSFQPNFAVDISRFIRTKVSMCKCHRSQARDYVSKDAVTTNSHYFYQRSYGRTKWKKNGHAEMFIMYASRSPLGGIGPSDPQFIYSLRLVEKGDGTAEWRDD